MLAGCLCRALQAPLPRVPMNPAPSRSATPLPDSGAVRPGLTGAVPGDSPADGDREGRQDERLFRAMADHAQDLLAVIDAAGVYTYVSGAYERILGISPRRLQGVSCFEHLHPDDHARVRTAIGRVMSAPGREEAAVYRLRREDGQYRVFEGRGRNMVHDPSIRGIVVISRDMTSQQEAEERLRRSE